MKLKFEKWLINVSRKQFLDKNEFAELYIQLKNYSILSLRKNFEKHLNQSFNNQMRDNENLLNNWMIKVEFQYYQDYVTKCDYTKNYIGKFQEIVENFEIIMKTQYAKLEYENVVEFMEFGKLEKSKCLKKYSDYVSNIECDFDPTFIQIQTNSIETLMTKQIENILSRFQKVLKKENIDIKHNKNSVANYPVAKNFENYSCRKFPSITIVIYFTKFFNFTQCYENENFLCEIKTLNNIFKTGLDRQYDIKDIFQMRETYVSPQNVEKFPFNINTKWEIELDNGMSIEAETVLAIQISEIRNTIEEKLKKQVKNVILVIPTKYTIKRINEFITAAMITGFDPDQIKVTTQINSAAYAYGSNNVSKVKDNVLFVSLDHYDCELVLCSFQGEHIKFKKFQHVLIIGKPTKWSDTFNKMLSTITKHYLMNIPLSRVILLGHSVEHFDEIKHILDKKFGKICDSYNDKLIFEGANLVSKTWFENTFSGKENYLKYNIGGSTNL